MDQDPARWRCQRDDCGRRWTAEDAADDADQDDIVDTVSFTDAGIGDALTTTEDGPGGPPTCANCSTVVSKDYHRVFARDDGVLEHCWNCASRTQRYSNDPVIDPSDRE
jgi:hypothetical protein